MRILISTFLLFVTTSGLVHAQNVDAQRLNDELDMLRLNSFQNKVNVELKSAGETGMLAKKKSATENDIELTTTKIDKSEILNLETAFSDSVSTQYSAPKKVQTTQRKSAKKNTDRVMPIDVTTKAVKSKTFRPRVDGTLPTIKF